MPTPFDIYKAILSGDPAALAQLGIAPEDATPAPTVPAPRVAPRSKVTAPPPGPIDTLKADTTTPGAPGTGSPPGPAPSPSAPAPTAGPPAGGAPTGDKSLADLARDLAKMAPADRDALMARKAGYGGARTQSRYRDAQAFERQQAGENPYQVTPEDAAKQVENWIHAGGPKPTRPDVWEKAGVSQEEAEARREAIKQKNLNGPRATTRGDFEGYQKALAGMA